MSARTPHAPSGTVSSTSRRWGPASSTITMRWPSGTGALSPRSSLIFSFSRCTGSSSAMRTTKGSPPCEGGNGHVDLARRLRRVALLCHARVRRSASATSSAAFFSRSSSGSASPPPPPGPTGLASIIGVISPSPIGGSPVSALSIIVPDVRCAQVYGLTLFVLRRQRRGVRAARAAPPRATVWARGAPPERSLRGRINAPAAAEGAEGCAEGR